MYDLSLSIEGDTVATLEWNHPVGIILDKTKHHKTHQSTYTQSTSEKYIYHTSNYEHKPKLENVSCNSNNSVFRVILYTSFHIEIVYR